MGKYQGVYKGSKGEQLTSTQVITREILVLLISVTIMTVGIYFFKFPNKISTGGVAGLAIIIPKFLPVTPSQVTSILNITLLLIGYMVFGRGFGIKTAAVTLIMSLQLALFEKYIPLTHPLTDEPVLELIIAILLPGIGSAMLFNIGASSGGTDIVAMILKKYTHEDIGNSLFITDMIIAVSIFFVYGIKAGLLSTVGLLFKAVVVTSAMESMNRVKYFTIITEKFPEIDAYITKNLHRGSTYFKANGGFTNKDKTVILCVVNSYQAVNLHKYIKDIDPTAFVMITNISHVLGRGFRITD